MPSTTAKFTSAPPACSTWPAACLPFSITVSAVVAMALPLVCSVREPTVPRPEVLYAAVALLDGDRLVRHAQPLGEDLREHGLVPLPVRLRAQIHFDRAVVGELDGRGFRHRRAAGDLHVIADAHARAACRAPPTPSCACRSRPSPRPCAASSRLRTGSPESMGTPLQLLCGNCVSRLRRRISMRSMPSRLRRLIHQPLHQIGGLGPAGAAIGADGNGVGDNRPSPPCARRADRRCRPGW